MLRKDDQPLINGDRVAPSAMAKLLDLVLSVGLCAVLAPGATSARSVRTASTMEKARSEVAFQKDTVVLYTVKPLDNLWIIAKKELGDPFKWDVIFKANPTIRQPNYIFPGEKLRVPIALMVKSSSVNKLAAKRPRPNFGKEEAEKTVKAVRPAEALEIPDIVIDRTRSPIGEDFFDLFNQVFNPPSNGETYDISVEERPLPGLGALVFVKVNGEYVFKRFLQPRYSGIREVAEEAAGVVTSYVANFQQIQRNLDGEDMSGTGIY